MKSQIYCFIPCFALLTKCIFTSIIFYQKILNWAVFQDFFKPHFTCYITLGFCYRHWRRLCHFTHCKLGATGSGFLVSLLVVFASLWHTLATGWSRVPFLPSIAEYSTSALCSLQYCWSNMGNERWRKNFINCNTKKINNFSNLKSIRILKAKISELCKTCNIVVFI